MKIISRLFPPYQLTAMVALLFLLEPALAENPGAAKDYGAETIEVEVPKKVKPLPVEMVEDSGDDAGTDGTGEEMNVLPDPVNSPTGKPPTGKPSNGDKPSNGASAKTAGDDSGTEQLNAQKMDISKLIEIFSRSTKRTYILDSNVKGDITILQPQKISKAEALQLLDTVLLMKNLSAVPVGKNTWKIVNAKDAKQTTIPLFTESKGGRSDALVTQLIRMKYVQSDMMQQTLAQFISPNGLINSFPSTNALIVVDSAANIDRLTKLIRQLDVPAVDQDITIIPIIHAEVKDVADKINEILGEKEGSNRVPRASRSPAVPQSGQNPVTFNPAAMTTGSQGGDGNKQTVPLKIIPDERTNSLIVVADQETTTKVRALVQQLDSPLDLSGGKFYVYRLKHADSEELASILNSLISGSGGEASESSKKSSTSGSSLTRSNRNRDRDSDSSFGSSNRSAFNPSARSALSTSPRTPGDITSGKVNFEGQVTITADPATNSLVINAGRQDYLRLKEVIDQLDVKRPQVLVEATILEVSLERTEGWAVELQGTAAGDDGGIIGQTNFGGLGNLISNPAGLSDLTVAAASTGTITLPGGLVIPSQAVLISALSRNQNVNVLSAPTVLTTDNQEAEIIVGQNVPFVTSTSTDPTNLNNTFNQVERQDVGITLRITPQISIGDFVTLRIFVEISNIVPTTSNDPNGPTTTIRTTETNVEVKSNQMIVTGGLIADNVTESTRGVPVLQDIPVLGNLFKRESQDQRRTNLLVFITPRIIKDQYEARDETLGSRDGLKKVINQQQSVPSREEYLDSKNMDNVVESSEPSDVSPSTITPPKFIPNSAGTPAPTNDEQGAIERTKKRLEALSHLDPQSSGSNNSKATETLNTTGEPGEDVLELRVKPKLPGMPAESLEAAPKKSATPAESSASRASLNERNSLDLGSEISGTQSFIVLRHVPGTDSKGYRQPLPEDSGLAYADNLGTVGIILPSNGSDTKSEQFFQSGRKYRYQGAPSEDITFVCLGKYGTLDTARTSHSNLANINVWHKLSPVEVMRLGSSQWLKAG